MCFDDYDDEHAKKTKKNSDDDDLSLNFQKRQLPELSFCLKKQSPTNLLESFRR